MALLSRFLDLNTIQEEDYLVFIGKVKNIFIKTMPGLNGVIQINPVSGSSVDVTHAILGELRVELKGDVEIEEGVDLLILDSESSGHLTVTGAIRYEV